MRLDFRLGRDEVRLASEGFCLYANLESRALQAQVDQRHAVNRILFVDILEWERRFRRLCHRNRIPDWLAIPLVMTPKLGHILFVPVNGDKPVSVRIIDDFHMDALDDNVSGVTRKRQILSVASEDDRSV